MTDEAVSIGLEHEREELLQKIADAIPFQEWADHTACADFMVRIEEQNVELETQITGDVLDAKKPPSSGEIMYARGMRRIYRSMLAQLRALRDGVKLTTDAALAFERREKTKAGMHYVPPPWGETRDEWVKEAEKRTPQRGLPIIIDDVEDDEDETPDEETTTEAEPDEAENTEPEAAEESEAEPEAEGEDAEPDEDVIRCEACEAPAVGRTLDGVPLCAEHGKMADESEQESKAPPKPKDAPVDPEEEATRPMYLLDGISAEEGTAKLHVLKPDKITYPDVETARTYVQNSNTIDYGDFVAFQTKMKPLVIRRVLEDGAGSNVVKLVTPSDKHLQIIESITGIRPLGAADRT